MRWLWSCVFCIARFSALFGQCPVSDFTLAAAACLNEQVELTNQAVNSTTSEWFFCNTNYAAVPSSQKLVSNYGAVYYSKFIQDGANPYLFFVSQTQNKLVGLRFTDLAALEYEVHCEIDLSAFIANPAGIDIINDSGVWTGLITSIVSPFKLVKIIFGQDFQSVAGAADLSSLMALSTPFDVKLLLDNGAYYAFVLNSTGPVNQQVIRLSFGASLANSPLVDYVGLPAASQASSMDFHRTCDQWMAFVSSRNGKVFSVNFSADLGTAAPVVTELALSAALNDPSGLALVEDHDELILIIQSRNGNTYTGKITSAADNTVDITNFGNIKSSSRDWDIEAFRTGDEYKIVSANFTNGGLGGIYTLGFGRVCPADIEFSQAPSELLSYNQAGTFKVTLKAGDAGGIFHSATKQVVVSGLQAPQIGSAHPPAYCESSPVSFQLSSDVALSGQIWDFGDGTGISSDPSPQYLYSDPGSYTVTLRATATNGCTNLRQSTVQIYEQPQADFALVSGLMCTNNEFVFSNNTPDLYSGDLAYQWLVDGNQVSNERDLRYTFTTTGPKEIALRTSIPGCWDDITKISSSVEAGPVVDFIFTGTCEDETFSFQNQISEPVNAYQWDFDNGHTSTDPNPSQVFTEFGNFSVSLTATSAIGCENKKTRTVSVRSKPVVDFVAAGPPNACAGTPTLFENQTTNPDGGEITTWLWNFGEEADGASQGELHGQHIYAAVGAYEVSLTSTTAEGCVGVGQSLVTINPSPSTEFTFGAACDDVPVLFTGPQDPDIADWYWEIGTSYYDDPSPTHTFRSPGDFPLYLEVTASNGCVATLSRDILVPIPLNPAFSYIKNCVGQEAVFTDITSGQDPVVSRSWNFNDGFTYSGSSVTYNFGQAGNREVALSVTAESGCSYETLQQISILPSPVAGFTANPSSGAFPLEVAFSNTSQTATGFLWEFLDGSGFTSTEMSPAYTFSGPGTFDVKLTATSGEQCESTFVASVTTVAPSPDADIDAVILTPNPDGSLKVIVTIHNKGNTIVRDLPVTIDFSGKLSLTQTVGEPIQPGTKYNLVLSTGILNPESNRYLCAAISLLNDLTPAGNRMCAEHEGEMVFISAYPNPTNGTLNVEWISETAQTVSISLCDAMGRQVREHQIMGVAGLNRQRMDVSGLENGIYLLRIQTDASPKAQRILVSGNP